MPPMPPQQFASQMAEMYRRLADLITTGTCQTTPIRVVVHDATHELADAGVRAACEEIARHGHKVGVGLELRGDQPRPCQFGLGGSAILLGAVVVERVTYTQAR